MNVLNISQEPDLGYYFYPSEDPDHPGHPRMDVVITAVPTYRHFDPVRASYQVTTSGCDVECLTICHPWSGRMRHHVCAGRVNLRDRRGKAVEAFTLGGELQIECQTDRTLCGLISPAPIFALFTTMDLPMWLTAEIEIILAHQKAHWDPAHPHDFEEHLARTDPLQFYACCLQALLEKGGETHSGSEELDQEGRHFVRSEIGSLKESGRWPAVVCPVEWFFSGEAGSRG